MPLLPPQSQTPHALLPLPDKQALVDAFVGRKLDQVRTPAVVIDRAVYAENCSKMYGKAESLRATFRAHVKSHKTIEGTRLQLASGPHSAKAVIVSTMMEAWKLAEDRLFEEGVVNDLLYGLPLSLAVLSDISALQDRVEPSGGVIRVMIDHERQIDGIHDFERIASRDPSFRPRKWSCFVKINSGGDRAGLYPEDPALRPLLEKILSSEYINLHGFYAHAGHSYDSTSQPEANAHLAFEVESSVRAAKIATSIVESSLEISRRYQRPKNERWCLSVGSTPTANSAQAEIEALGGILELHAGNYPLLDLQQVHTSLVNASQVSCSVLSTIISNYPARGATNGQTTDEFMCDAGGIAMSKDKGPEPGYGKVVNEAWTLSRISQEHGVLTANQAEARPLEIGQKIRILPQHACMTLSAHPWYYIVDPAVGDGQEIVDVWVPWKGW